MADIHDKGRALAIKMLAPRLKGFGLSLKLRKKSADAEYNPETGGQDFTWTEYEGSGLRTNFSREDISGGYIQQGDLRMLISPVMLSGSDMPTPSTNDLIEFDGSTYNVISVGTWNFAGVSCGWACQCRGDA